MSQSVETVTPMRSAQVIPFPVTPEDVEFMQDRHAALVTRPRRSVSWIPWGATLFVAVAVFWAAHAPLDDQRRQESSEKESRIGRLEDRSLAKASEI